MMILEGPECNRYTMLPPETMVRIKIRPSGTINAMSHAKYAWRVEEVKLKPEHFPVLSNAFPIHLMVSPHWFHDSSSILNSSILNSSILNSSILNSSILNSSILNSSILNSSILNSSILNSSISKKNKTKNKEVEMEVEIVTTIQEKKIWFINDSSNPICSNKKQYKWWHWNTDSWWWRWLPTIKKGHMNVDKIKSVQIRFNMKSIVDDDKIHLILKENEQNWPIVQWPTGTKIQLSIFQYVYDPYKSGHITKLIWCCYKQDWNIESLPCSNIIHLPALFNNHYPAPLLGYYYQIIIRCDRYWSFLAEKKICFFGFDGMGTNNKIWQQQDDHHIQTVTLELKPLQEEFHVLPTMEEFKDFYDRQTNKSWKHLVLFD
jgi:hypothetical protein